MECMLVQHRPRAVLQTWINVMSEALPRRGLLTRAAAAAAARTWLAMLDLGGRPRLFFGASAGTCTDCT